MCKVGDIIFIKHYQEGSLSLSGHSFVVINDQAGEVEGLPYDMICNVLSSFKDDAQKRRKLSYPGNFPISNSDTTTDPDNGRSGFIKTDQLYYFNKSKLDYRRIGYVDYDIMQLIFEFIRDGDFAISRNTDNL